MKKCSPLKCNVLIHFSHHPLISFGGKNDSFCALTQSEGVYLHPELSVVPNWRSCRLCLKFNKMDLVVSLWLRLTMGQIWFKAILRSRSISVRGY